LLDSGTVLVAAPGAAAGAARLLGAEVVTPYGATGGPDTALKAKAITACEALAVGARRVVVHVGGPDEASHERDPEAKAAILERVDRELLPPLIDAAREAGGALRVCPDHGCDPHTGAHDSAPVPCVEWDPDHSRALRRFAAGSPTRRLTERAVAELPVRDAWDLARARKSKPEALRSHLSPHSENKCDLNAELAV
jgi:2,3-bisphosphoglycerate-independent phosphoglycerate mutase